jgi:signal transduction histidine kinase
MESAWTLFVMLLFGVVIVAWQYDMRRVLWYVLLLAVAKLFALGPLLGPLPWPPLAFQVVIHTSIYLMVGFVITRMMAAQRAQRRALHEANVQITQYAAAQQQLAISHERNRMARELHDTLAHSLSAVAVQLEAVDSAMTIAPDEARHILGKALAQTRSGLTETRRALHELRATPLDDLGLALAIQNLAVTTAQRNGMTATVSLPEGALNLPPEIEQGVYRIAQEALTNAARHVGATQLKVALRSNGAVSLTVTDNGRGFDVNSGGLNSGGLNSGGEHMGLQVMRERAAMMGGVLDVQSTPGAGTTVRLVLP